MLVEDVQQLDEITDHLARCNMRIRSNPLIFHAYEHREVVIAQYRLIPVEPGVNVGELACEHKHLLWA